MKNKKILLLLAMFCFTQAKHAVAGSTIIGTDPEMLIAEYNIDMVDATPIIKLDSTSFEKISQGLSRVNKLNLTFENTSEVLTQSLTEKNRIHLETEFGESIIVAKVANPIQATKNSKILVKDKTVSLSINKNQQ